jgi:hypothetical protein
MKIVHASIPADDPQSTARVLAEIMGGEIMKFPPGGPHAWMAWSGDAEIELEIVPRGHLIQRDEDQGNWRATGSGSRGSEVHLAIAVDRPADSIVAVAKQAGWPARRCTRGGDIFELVEVWVDGCFMIEFMDREQSRHYAQMVTPTTWKQFLNSAASQPTPAS